MWSKQVSPKKSSPSAIFDLIRIYSEKGLERVYTRCTRGLRAALTRQWLSCFLVRLVQLEWTKSNPAALLGLLDILQIEGTQEIKDLFLKVGDPLAYCNMHPQSLRRSKLSCSVAVRHCKCCFGLFSNRELRILGLVWWGTAYFAPKSNKYWPAWRHSTNHEQVALTLALN